MRTAAPSAGADTAWRALASSPRDLWIVLGAKYLESVSLFSVLYSATLWLSRDHGLGDVAAGSWFGAFGTAVALATMAVGLAIDALGVRRALVVAFGASAVARGAMSAATSTPVAIGALLALSLGTAAGVPVMSAALRQYTTPRARPLAFAVYYAMLNLGAATAALALDAARSAFPALPFRALYALGAACAVGSLVLALFLRPPAPSDEPEAPAGAPPWAIGREVLRERAFWRFLLLVAAVAIVTLVYEYFHATWPKYVLREMGEGYPLGRVAAINSTSILVLAPLVTWLTSRMPALDAITVGSALSAGSVFVLAAGASTPALVAMVLLLSIGEAFWAPRFYAHASSIAPRGREATYMSLASVPMFVGKLVAGPLSGLLLARYCPETGPRDSATMWLLVGAMSTSGVIALLALRPVLARGAESAAP
jgi:MFS family permease